MIQRLIMQMIVTLKGVHDNGIIHCNIEPYNFMIERDDAFLVDFGLSVVYKPNAQIFIGSSFFAVPKLLFKKSSALKLDIFSLGMTLLYILCENSDEVTEYFNKVTKEYQ